MILEDDKRPNSEFSSRKLLVCQCGMTLPIYAPDSTEEFEAQFTKMCMHILEAHPNLVISKIMNDFCQVQNDSYNLYELK
jgi:hypothetical protein